MLMRAYDRALRPLLADATKSTYVGMPVTLGSYPDALLGPSALHQHGGANEIPLIDGFVRVLQTAVMEENVEQPTSSRPSTTDTA